MALPNITQDTLGNFRKIFIPIIIKWVQSINKKTNSNITFIRGPSR
jgi:hypothetical protein